MIFHGETKRSSASPRFNQYIRVSSPSRSSLELSVPIKINIRTRVFLRTENMPRTPRVIGGIVPILVYWPSRAYQSRIDRNIAAHQAVRSGIIRIGSLMLTHLIFRVRKEPCNTTLHICTLVCISDAIDSKNSSNFNDLSHAKLDFISMKEISRQRNGIFINGRIP